MTKFALYFRWARLRSKRILKFLKDNPTLGMIIGSILGFILALFIFFFENVPLIPGDALIIPKHLPSIKTVEGILNTYPDFFTWIMLFTIHTSAAVALGLAALMKLGLFQQFQIKKSEIIVSLTLVIIMMVVSSTSYIIPFNSGHYYQWPVMPLAHMWTKIIVLLAISISAAGISVLGLLLTACVCKSLQRNAAADDRIKLYFDLKESMERFLLITGYILSSGMVTVYFFMSSQAAFGHSSDFDIHGLTLFGLLFTVFIATSFIPGKLLLSDYGRAIVDQQLGHIPADSDSLKKWIDAREAMEKYLELKFNLIETIRYSIPILAPVLSSFLPAIFKK